MATAMIILIFRKLSAKPKGFAFKRHTASRDNTTRQAQHVQYTAQLHNTTNKHKHRQHTHTHTCDDTCAVVTYAQGLRPWTPLGATPPDPRFLALRARFVKLGIPTRPPILPLAARYDLKSFSRHSPSISKFDLEKFSRSRKIFFRVFGDF